ncbi:alpha/beta hydrolase [Nonomuraea rubra]|uniref:alpha/beta hydrolase n=1 Tax=Nonomuraea rubra TaxID=46180 RepID=UPI0031EC95BD
MKSQADFDAWNAFTKKLHADCRERTGPLYDTSTPRTWPRDLDALRAALGEEKLTYYGISYGTLIGQMYAEMFPGRVRALGLDSNMDHSLGVAGFLSTEALAVEDASTSSSAGASRDPSCVLHGQDIRAIWKGLLEKARRGELVYPSTGTKMDRAAGHLQRRAGQRGARLADAEPDDQLAERRPGAGVGCPRCPAAAPWRATWRTCRPPSSARTTTSRCAATPSTRRS